MRASFVAVVWLEPSGQIFFIVGYEQVERGFIFIDGGEAANVEFEPVVCPVVIDGRDLANQDITFLAPEFMPHTPASG